MINSVIVKYPETGRHCWERSGFPLMWYFIGESDPDGHSSVRILPLGVPTIASSGGKVISNMRYLLCIIATLSSLNICTGFENDTSISKQKKQDTGSSSLQIDIANQQLIDLSHTFDKQTIYWPTENGFRLIPEKAEITEKGYYYSSNRFMAAEHGGTHVDAPVHFNEHGKSVDQLPLQQLVGEAAVIEGPDLGVYGSECSAPLQGPFHKRATRERACAAASTYKQTFQAFFLFSPSSHSSQQATSRWQLRTNVRP